MENTNTSKRISARLDGSTIQKIDVIMAKNPDEFASVSDVIRKSIEDFYYREISKDLGIDLTNAIELSVIKAVKLALNEPIESMSKSIAASYQMLKILLSDIWLQTDTSKSLEEVFREAVNLEQFDEIIFSNLVSKKDK